VFANAPLDRLIPDAPPLQSGVRIRFFAALSRPNVAGGDTAVLVREADVTPTGGVHEDNMPADVPLFEQLVDSRGHVLRSARGPAHVAGLNFAPFGTGTKCVGCHVGHSVIEVPTSYSAAEWVNASPSAAITASSVAPGTIGARGIADRRTRGPAGEIAWIAAGAESEFVKLEWTSPIEVRELVLYALPPAGGSGTDSRVSEAEIRFIRSGREVQRSVLKGPLSASGSRFECRPIGVDAIEIRPLGVSGRVEHRAAAALSEVVTVARLAGN
jgi:hypothetical protein